MNSGIMTVGVRSLLYEKNPLVVWRPRVNRLVK